ncbi:MAG: hypothetical protein HKN17_08865 [Rhodothermales bacterium]|nr:hypothetical protein [Rhodothermales bacterium]
MSHDQIMKVDRSAISIVRLDEQKEGERVFWLEKTPLERLAGLEQTRQIFYGYDPSAERLQRVLEITERP